MEKNGAGPRRVPLLALAVKALSGSGASSRPARTYAPACPRLFSLTAALL
jgi:hypothetical protein